MLTPRRNKTRLKLWEEHLKDPIVALDKALRCLQNSGGSDFRWPVLASFKVCGRSRSGRAFGSTRIRWTVCLRTASMKYGPHGKLFSFLIQKEPATMLGSETFSAFFNADIRTSLFSADVLKNCALIAMHIIEEEREGREDGCHALDLGGEWKVGYP